MNKVILVGRLTKDPDVRYTQSGKAVCTFTLAVDRRSREAEKTADFIPIVAWERLAETCGNYLAKGRQILVEGKLQIRSYETNDGQKRWITEVVIHDMQFLGSKSDYASNSGSIQSHESGRTAGEKTDMSSFGKDVYSEEEIPF